MSAVAEASCLLRRAAEPRPIGDSIKSAINRAARRCGLKPSRAEDIWRGEARQIRAEEMDAIRRAAAGLSARRRSEIEAHAARLESAAAALEAIDPAFHGGSIDQLRNTARDIRRALAGDGGGRS